MPVVCHRPVRSNLTIITKYFSLNSLDNTTGNQKEVYGWDFAVFTQPVS